jgi:hypothetical protein
MQWEERIANYVQVTGFPRSLFIAEDGRGRLHMDHGE